MNKIKRRGHNEYNTMNITTKDISVCIFIQHRDGGSVDKANKFKP